MTGHARPEDGTDWRRLASDRNVSHGVARALWDQACAVAQDDPVRAEHAFHLLLDEAEAANITHEPGRETLTGSSLGVRDAASLGPGKWTRVLLEQPRPGSAERPADAAARPPSADELKNKIAAAGQAGRNAAAMLAASDPATIVEALRELRDRQGPGVLQQLMTVAESAVGRLLDHRSQAAQAQPGPAREPSQSAPDRTPAAAPPDRKR